MLDKSLVYKDIVMCLPIEDLEDLKVPVLPDGYSYKMFESGDEIAWAKLEVLVGEFDCFEDASAYFAKTFLTHEELLADRVCFIVNPEGEIVATTSAWFKTNGDIRFPLIHWVSTSPKEQGKGLGKAIVLFALSRFLVVEPDKCHWDFSDSIYFFCYKEASELSSICISFDAHWDCSKVCFFLIFNIFCKKNKSCTGCEDWHSCFDLFLDRIKHIKFF